MDTFGLADLGEKFDRKIREGNTVGQEVTCDGVITCGQGIGKQEELQYQVEELEKELMEIKKKHAHVQEEFIKVQPEAIQKTLQEQGRTIPR